MNKRLKTGIGPDGRMNALARKGEPIHDMHHNGAAIARGMEHQQTDPTLARASGKPKLSYGIAPHSGMHTRTKDGGPFVLGGDLKSRFDADPASPLKGPPAGKKLSKPMPSPGMRSRTSDATDLENLGKSILAEAFANSAPDDRAAHGYGIGALPDSVSEN